MKLKNVILLDISEVDDGYEYIYGVFGTSMVFMKRYYKVTFNSDLPHWWWSEIQKQMVESKIFFEDLIKKEVMDLGMGEISCSLFSDEDAEKYGLSIKQWNENLDKAVEKSLILRAKYKEKHGDVDLTKYSLFS